MSYKIKTICLQFSLIPLSLLFCLPILAQSDFSAVDQLLKQNQKALGNNFVALVWKDGKILYQKQGSEDFSPKTQASIESAGNWLTAALVMTFVDEGKLSLDDRVTQYIPLFAKYSKSYITIRHCLTNTTGIRAEGKTKFESLEEEINSYASRRDIVTNPGTEFYYSYVGPNIAARVLEIISKKSFDRLIQDRIIRPLKMKGTSFSNEEGGAINPAGGARSTANDYINFLSMLLNNGVFEGRRILSEKAVEELETSQFPATPIKSVPKSLQGVHFSLGSFITESTAAGKSNVLACPNMMGTIPYIDKCRNYAAILIVGKPEEEKKALYQSLKGLIDGAVGGSGCQ
ncbi:MAG: serine hydrolase [Chitinophagaceae bacterium]|nr:serine hydrolase [Chitinophagaceae bacterium]